MSQKAKIEIEMSGAAFEDDPGELGRILKRLADRILRGDAPPLRVYGNNTVGVFTIEEVKE